MKRLVIFSLAFFLIAAVPTKESQLISMAVGRVKGHVVTSREVNINFIVESILYGKKGQRVPVKLYDIGSKAFAREVTAVLLEWVVFFESEAFSLAKSSAKEIEAARKQLVRKTTKNTLWQNLKVSSKEVETLLRRKLQAKKFIRFKVESSVVPITDDEAREYFEANRVKFGNLPFDNFKQNIKSFLGRKQVDRRLKDWFEVLQSKYKVRNFLNES